MSALPMVVITGAAGTLGNKLRRHLEGRAELRLLDRQNRGDARIQVADLAAWGEWHAQFVGADMVFHFAADPEAYKSWDQLIGPNVDALVNAYQAAALGRVRRVVFASSNHVMGGYQGDSHIRLSSDTPPRPGLRYVVDGQARYSGAYAAAKLFGERLARSYGDSQGIESIIVRLGWVLRGKPNEPHLVPKDRGEWFRLMWLSDRDFLQLMDRCMSATLPKKCVIVNGMSANTGMPWDLEPGRRILGYEPVDDIEQGAVAPG